MPENIRLYLDQMLQTYVASVLRQTGYDVIRASEVGQSRADDRQILKKAIDDNRILVTLDGHFGDWGDLWETYGDAHEIMRFFPFQGKRMGADLTFCRHFYNHEKHEIGIRRSFRIDQH